MSRANESAFPQPADGHSMNGLTIREEFAKAAMQGTLANPSGYEQIENVVAFAVQCADALLAALAKPVTP